jgi:hypothetical protein
VEHLPIKDLSKEKPSIGGPPVVAKAKCHLDGHGHGWFGMGPLEKVVILRKGAPRQPRAVICRLEGCAC